MGGNALNKNRVLTFCGPHVLDSVFFPSLNVWTTLGQTSSFLLEPGFWILIKGRIKKNVQIIPILWLGVLPPALIHVGRICLLSVVKEATLNEQWIKPCVPFYLYFF